MSDFLLQYQLLSLKGTSLANAPSLAGRLMRQPWGFTALAARNANKDGMYLFLRCGFKGILRSAQAHTHVPR